MADPQLMIDGDLAVAFGLSRMTGIDRWHKGRLLEPANVVLRRSAGSWKIIHEHASFPWQWTEVGAL